MCGEAVVGRGRTNVDDPKLAPAALALGKVERGSAALGATRKRRLTVRFAYLMKFCYKPT
jgi:hypothetical protein